MIGKHVKANATIPKALVLYFITTSLKSFGPKLFREVVIKYPNKTAIFFDEQKWTFKELDAYSNRVLLFY